MKAQRQTDPIRSGSLQPAAQSRQPLTHRLVAGLLMAGALVTASGPASIATGSLGFSALATGSITMAGLSLGLATTQAQAQAQQERPSEPAPRQPLPTAADHSEAAPTSARADAIMRTTRFKALAAELRCLVCQNQSLLDSHASLAQDLRLEVVRLIDDGLNDRQIKQYLVDRYGEFVLYRPSWSWTNALLWAGPLLMLVAAATALWRLSRRRGNVGQAASSAAAPAPKPSAATVSALATTPVIDEDDGDEDDPLSNLSTEEALKRVDTLLRR